MIFELWNNLAFVPHIISNVGWQAYNAAAHRSFPKPEETGNLLHKCMFENEYYGSVGCRYNLSP